MPKSIVYCSECGLAIPITRKAMPKFNAIIELIDPHVCADEPIELNLKPNPAPQFVSTEDKGKFAKGLDEAQPPRPFPLPDEEEGLRDRRPPDTTAPNSILKAVERQKPEGTDDMD